jgi:hypothetical protein
MCSLPHTSKVSIQFSCFSLRFVLIFLFQNPLWHHYIASLLYLWLTAPLWALLALYLDKVLPSIPQLNKP